MSTDNLSSDTEKQVSTTGQSNVVMENYYKKEEVNKMCVRFAGIGVANNIKPGS